LFTNPFYYGEFEHPNRSGIWYKGAHTPMITRDEFDRAQVILGRTDRERSQKHSFAFVGIFRCGECGAMITAEEKWKRQENGNVHHYIYYHCTKRQTPRCPQKSIEEEELVRQISAFLMGLDVPELFADWAIDHVEQLRHEDDARDEAVIDDLTKRLARIDQSHQELTRMRYERLIADDEFLRERNRLQQEQSRTKEQIDKLTNSNGNWLDPARKAFEMVKSIYTRFTEGDTMMRRTIVLAVGSNLLLKDKKLIIEAKKPFLILQNGFRKVREILGGFEPPTLGFIEPLDSRLAAALAVWCTSVHEVRTSIQDEEVAQIVKRASAEPHSRQSRDRAA
jgi:predicted metal-binding protein